MWNIRIMYLLHCSSSDIECEWYMLPTELNSPKSWLAWALHFPDSSSLSPFIFIKRYVISSRDIRVQWDKCSVWTEMPPHIKLMDCRARGSDSSTLRQRYGARNLQLWDIIVKGKMASVSGIRSWVSHIGWMQRMPHAMTRGDATMSRWAGRSLLSFWMIK